MRIAIALAALALAGCYQGPGPADWRSDLVAIDGDTIRAGNERWRLLGIDTPEMPGHCRPGRDCVEGDPFAARRALASLLEGEVQCVGNERDYYDRRLVTCFRNGHRRSINDEMVLSGHARQLRYPL